MTIIMSMPTQHGLKYRSTKLIKTILAKMLPSNEKHSQPDTKSRLRQDRRRQRTESLSANFPSGKPQSLCIFTGESNANVSQGLGGNGRSILSDGTRNLPDSILGRPAKPTQLLLGHTTDLIVRPNTGLFIPAFSQGTMCNTGDTQRETAGAYTSMVINTVTNLEMRKQLLDRLRDITAVRAVNYLHYTFDCGDEPLNVNGVYSSSKLLRDTFPGFEMLRASEVGPLRFYGGPPSRPGWYYGSVLTLLLDKILCAYVSGQTHVVGRFLNLEM